MAFRRGFAGQRRQLADQTAVFPIFIKKAINALAFSLFGAHLSPFFTDAMTLLVSARSR